MLKAIHCAIEKNADIINLSIGGSNVNDEMLKEAIDKAADEGILVVCAAGNISGLQQVFYPGAYDSTVAVSALRQAGDSLLFASSYSNYGEWIDISAPGTAILSTTPDGYGTKSGTSMACPMVSGILADVISYDPELSSDEVYELLMESAQDLGDAGKDEKYGYGAVNAARFIEAYDTRKQLFVPETELANGSKISEGYYIIIKTKTLKGEVVYTVDGSEPQEGSPVYPKNGLCFEEGTVHIKVRTLGSDGKLSESVSRTYHMIPHLSLIEEKTGTYDEECIPIGAENDSVLKYPARRYQIELQPNEKLSVKVTAEEFEPKVYLFDREDASALMLDFTKKNEKYQYTNQTSEKQTVWLSIVNMNHSGEKEALDFSMEWSVKEHKRTVEESDESEGTEEVVLKETFEEELSEAVEIPEPLAAADEVYEENWLYTMEPAEVLSEGSEAVEEEQQQESAVAEEDTEREEVMRTHEGGGETMEKLPFFLATLVILLFGIGMFLMGYFPMKKNRKLYLSGVGTTAVVVRIKPTIGDRNRYQLTLKYRTSSGEMIVPWDEFKSRYYCKKHPVGSQIEIKYLPEKPGCLMLPGMTQLKFMQFMMLGTGIGLMLISVLFCVAAFTAV